MVVVLVVIVVVSAAVVVGASVVGRAPVVVGDLVVLGALVVLAKEFINGELIPIHEPTSSNTRRERSPVSSNSKYRAIKDFESLSFYFVYLSYQKVKRLFRV